MIVNGVRDTLVGGLESRVVIRHRRLASRTQLTRRILRWCYREYRPDAIQTLEHREFALRVGIVCKSGRFHVSRLIGDSDVARVSWVAAVEPAGRLSADG
jgi:hypothetical protein